VSDPLVEVDFKLSDAAMAAMKKAISDAIGEAFKEGFKGFDKAFAKNIAAAAEAMKKNNAFTREAASSNRDFFAGMTKGEAQAAKFAQSITELGLAVGLLSKTQDRARSQERQGQITDRERFSRAAQERLAIMNRETKLTAQSARTQGELQVNAAKVAGKQRVQIMRSVLETIGRLEKALGATISGIAKTATSAASRSFTALGSLIHRNNQDFTSGLSTSMRRRESTLSESFSRQERTVRESVLRQERQLTQLRTATSRGVLGAVTGRGVGIGIAGIVGGISLAQALKAGFDDAVNFGEQVNKSKIVFGQFADTVFDFAARAPSELGATKATVIAAAGNFGNLFKTIGLGQDVFTPMSTNLVKLATDLASFNNTPIDEVFAAMKSGLVGESEPLRNLGIDVSDARLKIEAMSLGIYNGVGVLTQAQKAQAAYSAIIKQTTDASGDFARTQDQGANAIRRRQAAFAQFVSDVTTKVLPVFTALNLAGVGFFTGLSSFINGGGGTALSILRDALKGAAIGMTAVIAAKGAVEVLKLLGTTAKLVATPLGALLVTAGLIGAAISVLASRSPALREALGKLGDRIGEIGSRIADFLQPAIEAAGRLLDNVILPAVTRFADFLGEHLLGALDATVAFIRDTAIPTLVRFASTVGNGLGNVWEFASEKVTGFFNAVRPYLQPAIDGFTTLGKAIGGAFGGDFAGLKGGAVSALSGIGTTIAGIAYAVGQALYPVGQKILTFFKDLFSGPNLKKYASAFLGLVEEIGRIIGTIVSSPAFLKAVAAIAAAAVIIGFRFVEGLARGIASNLPELVGMLRDGLVAGLKALWSNPLILVGALALAPLASRLFSLFRGMGSEAGTGFTAGLKTAMTGARGGAAALFGGLSGAVTSNALAANRAFRKEQQNLINQTRILGGDTSIISPRTMDEARAQLKRLGEGVTETQMKALRWRDTMQQAGIAVKGVFSGLGQTLKAIGPALAAPIRGYVAALKATDVYTGPGTSGAKAFAGAFRSSLSASKAQLVDGLRGSLSALENFAHSQGNSIGKQLALGVQRGATVALAAVGGFLAGKAEGASGGSGITSALTAGLVGASVGGPLVGAVAAGASVIGTAFGKAEHAAKVFKERMSEIGSTVRGDLEAALKSGKIAVLDFKSAFSLKGDEGLTDEITSLLKTDTKQALQDAGVSAQELMAAFREGEPAVAKLLKSIGLVFDDTIGFNKAERAAADVGTVFAGVATEIARINLDEAFNPTKIDKAATSANGFWSRMVGGARDFNTTASAARAVQDATDKVALYETALETAKGAWDSLFNIPGDTNLQEVIDNALISVDGMGPRIADALRTGGASADAQVRNIIRDMGTNIESVIKKGVEDGTVQTPEQAAYITKAIFDAAVAGIPTDSKAYQDAADAYQAAIEGVVPTLQSIDSAAATLAWGQALQDQVSKNPPSVPIVADVEAATAAGKAMSVAVDTGFGEFRPPAALMPAFDIPVITAAGKKAGVAVGDGFIGGIASKVAAVAAAAAAMARKAAAATNRNLEIESPSRVFRRMGRFIGEGLAEGITNSTSDVSDAVTRLVNRVVDAARAAGSGAADALRGIGSTIFDGMVGSGAEVNTGASLLQARGAITTALDGLRESLSGDNASTSLDINDALGVQNIQSLTSAFDTIADFGRVMLAQGVDAATVSTELQKQVAVLVQLATSLGFDQQGVEDMAASLGLSGEALGAFVTAAANAAADLAAIAAQVAQIDLFNQSFGSQATGPGTSGALNTATAGVTNAVQQVLSDWDSQIAKVFQIGSTDPTKLTASEKVIWDEILAGKVFSFDPTSVLGAGNLQSLTGAFDAIAKLGSTMLGQGVDAASVAAELQKQVDALTSKAAGLGFDSAATAAVAAQLGLSPAAIGDFVQNAAAAAAAATAPNPNAAAAAAAVAALPPAAIPVYHPPTATSGGSGGPFTPSADAEAAAAAAAAAAFQPPPSSGGSSFSAGLSPQAFVNAVGPPLAKVMLQALRAGR
jgi:hypothetical protein